MKTIRNDRRIDWPPENGGATFSRGDNFLPVSGELGTVGHAEAKEDRIGIEINWQETKYLLDLLLLDKEPIFVEKVLETVKRYYGRALRELGYAEILPF